MAVTITEAAANQIKMRLKERGRGVGIRLGIRTRGCSGMAYVLEYVDNSDEDDQVFKAHETAVYVDPKSLVYINGTELDYVKSQMEEGFVFNNPNVKDECGCGESFHV